MSTWKAPSWPVFGVSVALAIERGGALPTSVRRQPFISAAGRLGTLMLTTTGMLGQVGEQRLDHEGGDVGCALPLLVAEHLLHGLALDPPGVDRLAHGDPADAAVAGGQAGPDGAGVVDAAADIGARVDPRHHEIDVAEGAEAGEHRAQRRRAGDGPRLVDAVDVGSVHLGLHEPDRPDGRAVAGVLLVGRRDHHVAEGPHRPGQDVEADRVDAVVVGDQNSHPLTLSAGSVDAG